MTEVFDPKDHLFCEHCGARLKDGDAHTFEACEARQRVDVLRHIRDELRRVNLNLDAIAVAAKIANDKAGELRGFYGKIIEERRRARNAVVQKVLGKASAGAERLPKKRSPKRRTKR